MLQGSLMMSIVLKRVQLDLWMWVAVLRVSGGRLQFRLPCSSLWGVFSNKEQPNSSHTFLGFNATICSTCFQWVIHSMLWLHSAIWAQICWALVARPFQPMRDWVLVPFWDRSVHTSWVWAVDHRGREAKNANCHWDAQVTELELMMWGHFFTSPTPIHMSMYGHYVGFFVIVHICWAFFSQGVCLYISINILTHICVYIYIYINTYKGSGYQLYLHAHSLVWVFVMCDCASCVLLSYLFPGQEKGILTPIPSEHVWPLHPDQGSIGLHRHMCRLDLKCPKKKWGQLELWSS